MKNFFLQRCMITVVLSMYSLSATALDSCPFKGGDTISADGLCEMFFTVAPTLSTTIIGQWSTNCWDSQSTLSTPGTGTLTITSLTNISYTNSSPSGDFCVYGQSNDALSTAAFTEMKAVGNNALVIDHSLNGSSNVSVWAVQGLEKNRIVLLKNRTLIEMTRLNTVPARPTSLSVTASGTTVTLTWTDASSDETSFSILRKSSVTGTLAEVGTASAGATTYSETVSAGTYYYHVKAVNSNGASDLSNEVKITVE